MDLCCLLGYLLTGVAVILLLAFVDLKRRGYSREISWPDLLKLYVLTQLSSIKMYRMHKKFERDVRSFEQAQSIFLMDRIRRSENTGFGRDNDFSSIRSVSDFRRSMPLFDFPQMEDYVNRLADGEKSALLGDTDDVFIFITSSGTTGRNKRIPMSQQAARDMQNQVLFGPLQWVVRRHFPWNLRRILNVNNGRVLEKTKGGYTVSAAAHVVYARMNTLTAELFTTPLVGQQVKSEFESHYIHALFGLCDKHISVLRTVFVFNFLTLMRRIQQNLPDLLRDMRRGRIKEDLNIPPDVREELNRHLRPTPQRADEVEREFAKGMAGIVPRLWPQMDRTSGIWSGSTNETYYREARYLLGPDIPMLSFTYSASEGYMGSNIDSWTGPPRYTLIPDIMFYEFLPIVHDRIPELGEIDRRDLLLGHELEVGKEYEIIITNSSGFYRYRVGDVIKVVGFYQQAPQIEFLYRSGQSLNVCGEKTSEEVLFRALRDAARQWPSQLKDYTAAVSQFALRRQGDLSLCYILFIELEGEPLTETQTDLVDETLREQSEEYASYRTLRKLSKMTVHQVAPGTFARFRSHLIETTAVAANQFKMPRVLKSPDSVAWFMDHVQK
ncbi:probable indole-3-acetic acid-amido synthetase GH3.9 isoform X2 [Amphibalanus amphitrite]|uniref:probable indole-3-acetic acid-amido synthetase GH3.9 isoform X1 n=1 Tax=Amphibalanus amphitrite TaxID=1232801 RepID=UPI001C90F63F|nr:probable indole-3-acetic acid-amido synthetase GH3.9 isoform X1 [Amphibalanus amphitrite]XP_043189094.1 probable indole-3-acetic acid-amido synthetase GH3.9 isoform X2 [Amphibalanus amphitrite]